MNQQPELNVVIVNYNSGQALEQCVAQLMTAPAINISVCVVDNDSNDDSVCFIDSLKEPVRLISNSANVGFSKACNQGAMTGQAAQIAFINPDCFVSCQQLQQLSINLNQTDSAALIGCKVLNEDGSLQAASRRRLPTFWRIVWHLTGLSQFALFKGINIKDTSQINTVKQVEAVNGACILIKREAFNRVGGFDEGFPLHFEDLDLFARLQADQYIILYDSNVSVTHLKGQSTQSSQQIMTWKKQGLLRYFAKHRPRWEYRLAGLLLGGSKR